MTRHASAKFKRDILWNALSFVFMAMGGVALNILLLTCYGAETLGAFNQVYAIYILLAQFAAFGLYLSVLRHVSENADDLQVCGQVLSSALALGALIAGLCCLVSYLAAPYAGMVLDSESVASGLTYAIAGLWCFALNKILLAFLNGMRFMRAFALFQIYRFAAMPLFLGLLALLDQPGYISPVVFTLAECSLFMGLMVYILLRFPISLPGVRWLRQHLSFGGKSLVGGAVAEANTRVDVLLLGAFCSDKVVGVYSFAAMLAEGIDQIPGIFRVNFNPLVTRHVTSGHLAELRALVRRFLARYIPLSLLGGLAAVFIFPVLVAILAQETEVAGGWWVYVVLLTGVVLRSGYAVFWEIPTQSGYPGYQTLQVTMVLLSNIALNAVLVPLFGMHGAAVATATSLVLSVVYLRLTVYRVLRIRI